MKEDKIWTKNFTTMAFTHSLFAVGIQMLIPTIPLFLVSLGATESQVGIVATVFYVTSIITRFMINVILARIGKKRVLIVGLFLSTIVMAMYGLVESVGVATALRVAQGIGFGASTTIATTLAVDFLPDTRRSQGVGYLSLGLVIAQTIAPAIALYFRSNHGFLSMFLVAACTNLISGIMVFFIEEPHIISAKPHEERENTIKALQWRDIFDRKLILPSAFVFLYGMSRCVDMNFIALFAEAKGLEHLSWYFVVQTATMFCVRLFVGRLADRKGRNWALIPGGFSLLATLVTLSFAETSAIMLLGAFFSGLGVGILAPNLQVWLFSIVAPEKRNIAGTAFYNFVDIGTAIGAPLMGLMAENFGYPVMFRVGACAALMYIIGYIAIGREKRYERRKNLE